MPWKSVCNGDCFNCPFPDCKAHSDGALTPFEKEQRELHLKKIHDQKAARRAAAAKERASLRDFWKWYDKHMKGRKQDGD